MAAIFGLLLTLVGVLIIALPELLAYFVGGVFIVVGVGAIAAGMKVKSAVTYRRIDAGFERDE